MDEYNVGERFEIDGNLVECVLSGEGKKVVVVQKKMENFVLDITILKFVGNFHNVFFRRRTDRKNVCYAKVEGNK